MKAIAMKCTQEQFDSIKDRIPLPIGKIVSFTWCPYLLIEEGFVSNCVLNYANHYKIEVIEHFDLDYFLECCGVEKTWKGSEMQYKQGDSWVTFPDEIEIRKKPSLDLIDSKYTEMQEILVELHKNIETWSHSFQSKIEKTKQLIKEITEL